MNADGEQTAHSLANAPMADQAKREWLGLDARPVGYYPGLGFAGLKLDRSKPYRNCIPTVQLQWDAPDEYIYHFPDGNHGICKLILGRLIPGIGAPQTMEAEPLARIDYAGLDLPRNNVRVRLNSPVVKVRHVGDPYQATTVEVTYAKDGGSAFITPGSPAATGASPSSTIR